MRQALLILLLVALAAPALAQQRHRQTDWRPSWAGALPELPDVGQIGMFAVVETGTEYVCEIKVTVMNRGPETIRAAQFVVEVFFGGRSVIADLSIRMADRSRWREATVAVWEPCRRPPTRLVVREASACLLPNAPPRRSCGLPVVPIAPRFSAPVPQVPVEIAPNLNE